MAATKEIERPVLGVERSISGKRWRARLTDQRGALALAQQLELPEIVARVMAARGIGVDEAAVFLNPTLRDQLPDPLHLLDMEAAVERIVAALTGDEVIGVFGDYDVDGATSSALLVRFFAALGRTVPVYIPDRRIEGFGPNIEALMKLKAEGVSLVITVDCGTTAFEPLAAAVDAGLDVIVIDHHVAEPQLPRGALVVNPNRLDETSEHGQLAAVGVTFLLVVALNRALREAFWYGEGHGEPDLRDWLDLVALGTVCDVVPLTGVNRALVAQGLKIMAGRRNRGIVALAEVAGIDRRPDAYHLGYMLGPRVNAGGRVGESGLGTRLLSTEDEAEAGAIAARLDDYNRERQVIEAEVLDAAMAQASDQAAAGAPVLLCAAEGWHAGVIGIVAGRLRERFERPACVVALENGTGKGSGRSVPGVALGPAVIAARQAGLLIAGGGHAMAAGFTVAADALDAFRDFLTENVARQIGSDPPVPSLGIDGTLAPVAGTTDLIEQIEQVGPFGAGNPRPRFAFADVRVVKADVVGKGHVRCIITGQDGTGRLTAIAFRTADTELGQALLNTSGGTLHLAGNLQANEWQGRVSAQLVIDDAALVRPG
jgi:single-stranded-DNA-specific exonuclease